VWFAECAAVLAWPDGGRGLMVSTAIEVSVEPSLLRHRPAGHAWLDTRLAAERASELPQRNVPRPQAPAASAGRAAAGSGRDPDPDRLHGPVTVWGLINLAVTSRCSPIRR